jgi:mannosyl-3-phosphoglycerate synthase
VNIHTVQFAHILETNDLDHLRPFLSQTAFVISHKSESVESLLRVLWYIPTDSSIIIVTNCPEGEYPHLARELQSQLKHHKNTYLVHQKDEHIARLFQQHGVDDILGIDSKVVDGKGEGMYIGALCAYQLNYPRWLIFYDADNFVPSALLEYTMAMSRLFLSPPPTTHCRECQATIPSNPASEPTTLDLHNVRICWASKPELGAGDWKPGITGRTTQVVSPLLNGLREDLFGADAHTISSSNAGEQGMTINTATLLRFSSGFSVETFQLLDLLFKANAYRQTNSQAILHQYISQSPHFHEK